MSSKWCIAQPVAVVCQEDLFVVYKVFNREKTFSDISPDPSVNQRDMPIRWFFANNLNLRAKIRDYAIAVFLNLVVQEISLDNVSFIPKAQNEVIMRIL